MAVRQVVLDTETTGIDWKQGHRVIEIGAVELIDRRVTGVHYQQYLKPQRSSDPEALRVHGLTAEFLQDKPGFAEVADAFLDFLGEAELIIHNAPFDLGFLNHELQQVEKAPLRQAVMDTLVDARRRHPGQKNDLNSLCRRYNVDNSRRDLHGALLDCEILAEVYLAMTRGQDSLAIETVLAPPAQAQSRGGPVDIAVLRAGAAGLQSPYLNVAAVGVMVVCRSMQRPAAGELICQPGSFSTNSTAQVKGSAAQGL